jgi:hypothetical protein
MAKLDESEGEVLSREEMKTTKGGAGAAAAVSQEGLSAPELKGFEAGALDTSIEAETLNIPSQHPIGVNVPPNVPLKK